MSRRRKEGSGAGYAVQRRWPRVRVTTPVVVQLGMGPRPTGPIITGSALDLCPGGVYVVSQEQVRTGESLQVHVGSARGGDGWCAVGSVVRAEDTGFAVAFVGTLDGAKQIPPDP